MGAKQATECEVQCVVCRQAIAQSRALYANTWERTRKRFPLCTPACVDRFDPDLHWLPACLPAPAPEAEVQRLLQVAAHRLSQGNAPRVVTRDLLLAGIEPGAPRSVLARALAQANLSRSDARSQSIAGVLLGIFTGSYRVAVSRDRRSPDALTEAFADVDAWQAHANVVST